MRDGMGGRGLGRGDGEEGIDEMQGIGEMQGNDAMVGLGKMWGDIDRLQHPSCSLRPTGDIRSHGREPFSGPLLPSHLFIPRFGL